MVGSGAQMTQVASRLGDRTEFLRLARPLMSIGVVIPTAVVVLAANIPVGAGASLPRILSGTISPGDSGTYRYRRSGDDASACSRFRRSGRRSLPPIAPVCLTLIGHQPPLMGCDRFEQGGCGGFSRLHSWRKARPPQGRRCDW